MTKFRRVLIVGLAILLAAMLLLAACGKKEEAKPQAQTSTPGASPMMQPSSGGPSMPPAHPGGQKMMAGGKEGMPPGMSSPHGPTGPKTEKKIVVPKEVEAKWKAVTITVAEKKEGGKSNTYTINIKDSLSVPGSNLTIKVEAFLPNFTMTAGEFTSVSNEPKNPACYVIMKEGGQETKNWLFANYPDQHAVAHPVYKIILVGGVPKG